MKSSTGSEDAISSAPPSSSQHMTPETDKKIATSAKKQHQLEDLAKDYATISKLMVDLDKEVEWLTKSVGSVVHSVPAHDGLSAMLETFGDSTAEETGAEGEHQTKKMRRDKDDGIDAAAEDAIMGDEAAEKDDPLVFL